MTLKINKKNIIIAVIIIIVVAALIGLYYLVYNKGYKCGYDKGKVETTAKYESPKGNGTNFYSEEIIGGGNVFNKYMIYHSIPDCKAIKDGVMENRAYTDSTFRMSHSKFCPKCMDEKLIEKCQAFLEEEFN